MLLHNFFISEEIFFEILNWKKVKKFVLINPIFKYFLKHCSVKCLKISDILCTGENWLTQNLHSHINSPHCRYSICLGFDDYFCKISFYHNDGTKIVKIFWAPQARMGIFLIHFKQNNIQKNVLTNEALVSSVQEVGSINE